MRNPLLDALRGLAVILVFCYHSEAALLVNRFGWVGVDLFFVLSGFLVSGLLFTEYKHTGSIRPGWFLVRRGFKIYPQFYVFLLISISHGVWLGLPLSPAALLPEVVFLQNYVFGIWTHTWSLAVEEHFYLLLAGAFMLLIRRRGSNPFDCIPIIVPAIAIAVLFLRVITWWLGPITPMRNVFATHLRVDSLLWGVLLAYAHAFERNRIAGWAKRWQPWLAPASVALLAPIAFLTREDPFMVTIGFSLVGLGCLLLLVTVLYPTRPIAAGRGAKVLARIGKDSYAFYLWHGPLILWMHQLFALPPWAEMFASFLASWAVASLTTRWIEKPALAWRDRWFPSPRSTQLLSKAA